MGMAATTVAEETAIREHNPLFQSMGTEEAVMAVANRVEEVTAVEMAVTTMEAAANATSEMDEDSTEAEEAEHVAAQEAAAQEEAEIGGGASGRQTWDQSRMFDPEKNWHISKFDSIFPN